MEISDMKRAVATVATPEEMDWVVTKWMVWRIQQYKASAAEVAPAGIRAFNQMAYLLNGKLNDDSIHSPPGWTE